MIKIRDYEGDLGEALWRVSELIGVELLEEEEGVYQMWAEKCYLHIPKYNINIHDGYVMTWDEDTKDFEVASSSYYIFDSRTHRFLYSSQSSSLDVTLYNYLNLLRQEKDLTIRKVNNLGCYYMVDKIPLSVRYPQMGRECS